jgi:hypothetical protein
MRLECRLRQLLRRYRLDEPGLFSRIEGEARVSRKVVSDLYYNRKSEFTFLQLERLCGWLLNKGVPGLELPGALFGFSPSGLVKALIAAEKVKIYLGEYYQPKETHMPTYWVSWADSEVASTFIELASGEPPLVEESSDSTSSPRGQMGPRFEFVLVPSHDAPFGMTSNAERPPPESAPAERIFSEMRDDRFNSTNILIGSQRANLLVELFVAELFGCDPFVDAPGKLPFYLYRESWPSKLLPSCFGGSKLPANDLPDDQFGIYYRGKDGNWELCPHVPNATDAGIVIVRRVPAQGQTELALFGYSAQATRVMGQLFRQNPDQFWKRSEWSTGDVNASVYVCGFSMREDRTVTGRKPMMVLNTAEVHPLKLKGEAEAKAKTKTKTKTRTKSDRRHS